jgi:hypothetical protein
MNKKKKFTALDLDVYEKKQGYEVHLRNEQTTAFFITEERLEAYYYDSELDRREIGYMDPRESHGYNEYTTYVDFHTALEDGELDDILAEYISDNLETFI